MPYINLDLDYLNHPRTMRLIGMLGRGAEILPIRLWLYCGKYLSDSGSFAGFSAQEIETIACWWGKSGEMIAALEKCVDEKGVSFLTRTDNGWEIPNWLNINGHLGVFRERAKIAAKVRWDKYRVECSSNASSNAQAITKQCSIPYQAIPKKEKNIKKEKVRDGPFVKPTREEVEAYGREIQFKVDGEAFLAYYNAKNWKIGNTRITDWKACIVTWKKNEQKWKPVEAPTKPISELLAEKKNRWLRAGRCGNCGGSISDNRCNSCLAEVLHVELNGVL